ncbi:MAG TPA: hypothetical protein VH475_21205, partial [Tepidisphaeraceae bacterium]
ARAANGESSPPDYVVKVFHPPHRISGHDALKPAIEAFLERARLQQDVATSGARYWAPVYESGATRPGAYYVSRYYARSAQKLIASRVKLSDQALHTLVDAIVQGLRELKEACGRAHGNLTPSNILIGGEGDIEQAPIVLTDPAPPDELAKGRGEADDLTGLGEVIYQLVLHRPFRGMQSWPVPRSAEWTRLGNKGEGWRELCNQLLDPNARAAVSLEEVGRRVAALRPRRWLITPRRLVAAAVVALIAFGVLFAIRYTRFKGEWREFCQVTDDWFYRFQMDLKTDPARLRRLQEDPHLAKAIAPVIADTGQLDPKRVAGNSMLRLSELAEKAPLSWQAIGQTRQALATIRTLQAALSPAQWPLLRELTERQRDYQKRGWDPCARYLGRLIEDVSPQHRKGELSGTIDWLLGSQQKLKDDLAVIESQWQTVEDARRAIAERAPGDKVLTQFDPFVQRYMASATAGQEVRDPADLRAPVVALGELAGHLNEVLQPDWEKKVDRARLVKEAPSYAKASPLDEKDFQNWLGDVQDYYRFTLKAGAEPVTGLEKQATETRKQIDDLRREVPNAGAVVDAFDKRLVGIGRSVADFQAKSWVNKDRRTDAIGQQALALQNEFKTLTQDVWLERSRRTEDQKKWWGDVNAQVIAESAVINASWKQWLGKQPVDVSRLPMDPARFAAIKLAVDQRKTLLSDLDKNFPPAPTLDEPYAEVARGKREDALASILTSGAWIEEHPDAARQAAQRSQAAKQYTDWCNDAQALLKNVADARWLLDNTYGLADAPALAKLSEQWKSKAVWKDLSGQPAVAALLRRLDELAAVGSDGRAQLTAKAIGNQSPPEIVLAAWRGLAGQEKPQWPAGVDELKTEAAIRRRLADLIARAPDAFRRKLLTDEVQRSGPPELVRFLNGAGGAGTPEQIDVAIKAASAEMEPFGVPTAGRTGSAPVSPLVRLSRLEGLGPEVRYNLLLHGLRQSAAEVPAADTDAARVARLTNEFRDEIKTFATEFQQRKEVAELLAGLDRLNDPEPPAGPVEPWRSVTAPPGHLRFVSPGPADTAQTIEFARVEPQGGRPFYLSTTELSLAQFRAIIPAADWVQSRKQLLFEYSRNDDPRPGPRVWQWSAPVGNQNSPIEQSEYWLRERDTTLFQYLRRESGFNHFSMDAGIGVNPSGHPKLPMQYLPAPTALYVAGLLGCRLPTPGEWKAAYARAPQGAPWNVRDQSWDEQRRYVADNGGRLEWPDAGAFWPKDYKGPRRTGADAQPVLSRNDRNLWFREVDDGEGQEVFANLVGNVAEFTWDDPRLFDQLRDKSIGSIAKLLEQHPDKMSVIGGSALSAPELEVTRPYPVDLGPSANPPSGSTGYADVGMRLAFSAPGGSPGQRLVTLLRDQGYLVRR